MFKAFKRWLLRVHLDMTLHDMAVTRTDIADARCEGDTVLAADLTTYHQQLQQQAEALATRIAALS